MTPLVQDPHPSFWEGIDEAVVVDLAQPMRRGMPQSPTHAPFRLLLEHRHGDRILEDGSSIATELIMTGGHIGTHIDSFAHVSHGGCLHGGIDARAVERFDGFSRHGIESFRPFVGRAILLDVAAVHGVATLPAGYEVTVADLERACERAGTTPRPGDAILIGTGWSRTWADGGDFSGITSGAPGPGADAGRWLAAQQPTLVGGETLSFEHIPAGQGLSNLPVHTLLLVEKGIHIVETMRLEELLDRQAHDFALIVAPLPLVGATGAPVRPLALLPPTAGSRSATGARSETT